MKTVGKMVLTLVALLSIAATASAATDKLVVKDNATPTPNTVFKVDDTGAVTSKSETTQGLTVTDAAATPKVTLTNTGRIGLSGFAAPTVALHAKGAGYPESQAIMNFDAVNANGGGGFIAYHNNNGALPNSGDRLGYFLFGSINPTTLETYNGGGISAKTESAWSKDVGTGIKNMPTAFVFETAPANSNSRLERLRIGSAGIISIGAPATVAVSGTGKIHMAGDTIRIDTARTPASATAACNQGEISWDSGFVYVCVATNSWKRAAITSW